MSLLSNHLLTIASTGMAFEKQIENRIKNYLKGRGAWVIKIHGGPFQSVCPDLVGCHKGRFFAFEVKNENGKLSKAQEVVLKRIRKSGGIAGEVASVEEVERLLS